MMVKALVKLAEQVRRKYERNSNEAHSDMEAWYKLSEEEELYCSFDIHGDGGVSITCITYSNRDLGLEDVDIYNEITESVVNPYGNAPSWIR